MADTNTHSLLQLQEQGQSVWMDYLRRNVLRDGTLERQIREWGLRGVTSNPSIFEKAVGAGDDYDDTLQEAAEAGLDFNGGYERLAVEDIKATADLFRPLYDRTDGKHGFVSLEVSPELAYDMERTLAEARRLWKVVDRPNLLVKVPGTDACIPAIEQLISEGINVNITLLFSLAGYQRVMEAYLRGLERRQERGEPLERIASVASFFVSRVDTAVDDALQERIDAASSEAERKDLRSLLGKVAIANAKLAYRRFEETFAGERWERLKAAGARLQRPLWASTSTKNPEYRDVVYVEELIGPHTVNTMPVETLEVFADHGRVHRTVDQNVDQAEQTLRKLRDAGIDFDAVTERLQTEGVDKFAKSFRALLETVEGKMTQVAGRA